MTPLAVDRLTPLSDFTMVSPTSPLISPSILVQGLRTARSCHMLSDAVLGWRVCHRRSFNPHVRHKPPARSAHSTHTQGFASSLSKHKGETARVLVDLSADSGCGKQGGQFLFSRPDTPPLLSTQRRHISTAPPPLQHIRDHARDIHASCVPSRECGRGN
eukprot:2993548-Rhodomonas_salina.1